MDFATITIKSPTGRTFHKNERIKVEWEYSMPAGHGPGKPVEGHDHRQKHQYHADAPHYLNTRQLGRNKSYRLVVEDDAGNRTSITLLYEVIE